MNVEIEDLESELTELIQSKIREIAADIADSDITEQLPEVDENQYQEEVEIIASEIHDRTVTAFEEFEPDPNTETSQTLIPEAALISGFFIAKVLQEAGNRIRSAWQARQVIDEDRQEVVDKALETSLSNAESTVENEIGSAVARYEEQIAIDSGFSYYRYVTVGDEVVRDLHRARNGKIFRYGSARVVDDIPSMAFRCRCISVPLTDEQAQSESGNFFYPEDAPSVTAHKKLDMRMSVTAFGVNGDIGDPWEGNDFQSFKWFSENELAQAGEISIDMTSEGGLLSDGLAMYDYIDQITSRGVKVNFNVVGHCGSAATLPMCAATNVTAGLGSRILAHEASGGYIGKADGFDAVKETVEEANQIMADIYARKTGKSIKEIRELMSEDRYITAKRALEFGLIDEIRGENSVSNDNNNEDDFMSDTQGADGGTNYAELYGSIQAKHEGLKAESVVDKEQLQALGAENKVLKAAAEDALTDDDVEKRIKDGIEAGIAQYIADQKDCLLYTSPSPRDKRQSRMPSSA